MAKVSRPGIAEIFSAMSRVITLGLGKTHIPGLMTAGDPTVAFVVAYAVVNMFAFAGCHSCSCMNCDSWATGLPRT